MNRKLYTAGELVSKLETFVGPSEMAHIESSIEHVLAEDDAELEGKLAINNVGYQMRLKFGHVKWLQFLNLAARQEKMKNND